ncbi:hypothetical protein AnigIFM56816_002771 [Aspergillus niger]|nr:hypothetical protein AnigIFM56816_002771 [Aspergillus niger]
MAKCHDKKKKKKKGISNTVIAPLEGGLTEHPVDPVIPELKEYAQAAECPYTTPIITLKKTLQFEPEVMHNEYWGSERHHHQLCIEPQCAHTFIHYLYTGQYEALKTPLSIPRSADDVPTILNTRDGEEFQRAAYVYQAAVRYEIPGLLSMAQHFMARFAERLSIDGILRAIRRVYGSLLSKHSGRMWLKDFVRDQLDVAFINTDGKLRQIFRDYEVGNSGSFDNFVVDEVLALYEREQDRMKSLGNSKGGHEPVPDSILESECKPEPEPEPTCEPACEPEPVCEPDYACGPKCACEPKFAYASEPVCEPVCESVAESVCELVSEPEFANDPEPACDPEPLFEPDAEEAIPAPEPELEQDSEPTSSRIVIAPRIPDNPLYYDWDRLHFKDRKKWEKRLIKLGLPIPGKDFEIPVPDQNPPVPEPERETPAKPEPEPAPRSSSSCKSWDMPVVSDDRLTEAPPPPEAKPEAETEPVPMSSSSFGSWDTPVSRYAKWG